MPKIIDLTGRKFGRLTVLRQSERIRGRIAYVCACECGNETLKTAHTLRVGDSKSCGCLLTGGLAAKRANDLEYAAAMKRLEEELAAACDNCGGHDVREEAGFDGMAYDVCVDCGDVGPMREAEPAKGEHATRKAEKVAAKIPPPVATGRRLPWGAAK